MTNAANALLPNRPVVLVGAGKMGGALLRGWLDSGLPPQQVIVRDPKPDAEMTALLAERGIAVNVSVQEIAARKPQAVMLAVKPQMMDAVAPELAPLMGDDCVGISIAAGLPVARFEALLGQGAFVRAMPNTPATYGKGITGCFAKPEVTAVLRDRAEALLAAAGEVVWLEEEGLIDAVTAVSGSGPAYVFHLVEAMADAGTALGLPADTAMQLARATVAGAGEMLSRSEQSAEELRKAVTSPGGTTAAALSVLMGEDGLSPLLAKAERAAFDRAKELGS